jgi:hypothetical protein
MVAPRDTEQLDVTCAAAVRTSDGSKRATLGPVWPCDATASLAAGASWRSAAGLMATNDEARSVANEHNVGGWRSGRDRYGAATC